MGRFSIDWSGARKEMEAVESKKDYTDKRLFTPDFNKNGTSETIIRFLPSKDTTIPYAKVWSHSFQNKGMWYIENCMSTIKKNTKEDPVCPVCQYNGIHWDDYSVKEQSDRKRKANFFGNILVIKDPLHPENNGKVFLFRYGMKIHNKLMEKFAPPKDSIFPSCPIWDWEIGRDFNLVIKKIKLPGEDKPQNNYDSSCFVETSTAVGTDEQIDKIISQCYSIKDYYDPKNFKDMAETADRFDKVIGNKSVPVKRTETPQPPVTDSVEDEEISDSKSIFDSIQDED